MSAQGWIGVDLDGTAAHYDTWRGPGHIGAPIDLMVRRIQLWLAQGKDVRIFTARAAATGPDLDAFLEAFGRWCDEHIGRRLVATCVKDYLMIELWDDRCKQVVPNTGIALEDVVDGLVAHPRDAIENTSEIDDVAQGQRL